MGQSPGEGALIGVGRGLAGVHMEMGQGPARGWGEPPELEGELGGGAGLGHRIT